MPEWIDFVRLGATSWTLPRGLRSGGPTSWTEAGIEASHVEMCDLTLAAEADSIVGVGANGACDRPPASAATRAELFDAIELAAGRSVPLVYLPSFEVGEPKTRDDRERLVALVRDAAKYATRNDVELAWELPFAAADVAGAFDQVSEPVSYLPDLQNAYLWHIDLRHLWELGVPFASHCHVKDGVGGVFGNSRIGEGDAKPLHTLRMLLELGYRPRYLLSESECGDDASGLHKDLAAIWEVVTG